MRLYLSILALFLMPINGFANTTQNTARPFLHLFEKSSSRWGPPSKILRSIAAQESSYQPWCVNVEGKDYYPKTRNEALAIIHQAERENRLYDVGLMQINRYWLRYLGLKPEIVVEPSINVHIAAWILSKEIQKYGFNWKAIGSYHSPASRNPERAKAYAQKIMQRAQGE